MCTSLIDENKVVMNLEAHNLQYISRFITLGIKGRLVTTFYKKKLPNGLSIFRLNCIRLCVFSVVCCIYKNMATNVAVIRVECCFVFCRSYLHLMLRERASWMKFPWISLVPPGRWRVSASNYATITSFPSPSYSLLVKYIRFRGNIFWGNGSVGK